MEKKERTIITRVKFCHRCFDLDQPKPNQMYVVYGNRSQEYHYNKSFYYGVRGFSPHIILLDKVIGEVVKYYYSCSICNTTLLKTPENRHFYVILDETFQLDTISLKEWNWWIRYKDEDYKL